MFNVGDKVILISKLYMDTESNPLYGGKYGECIGIVEKVDLCGPYIYQIEWPLLNTSNDYRENDLELYSGYGYNKIFNDIIEVIYR